jgi:hypothetical protein
VSIRLISQVFDLDLPTKEKFILLVLADCANDITGQCFPSIATISRKTSIPERTIQRTIQSLIQKQAITVTHDYRQKRSYYVLSILALDEAPIPDCNNCPAWLRKEVIETFQNTCQYCDEAGSDQNGPDGKPWEIDRIVPGARGGKYVPGNVTLACKNCNLRKRAKAAKEGTWSLAEALENYGAKSAMVPNESINGAKSDKVWCQTGVANKEEPELTVSTNPLSSPLENDGGNGKLFPDSPKKVLPPPKEHSPVHLIRTHMDGLYQKYNGVPVPWGAAQARMASDLVKQNPSVPMNVWFTCINNHFRSEGRKLWDPKRWIPRLLEYKDSPIDKFNQPMEVKSFVAQQKSGAEILREQGIIPGGRVGR